MFKEEGEKVLKHYIAGLIIFLTNLIPTLVLESPIESKGFKWNDLQQNWDGRVVITRNDILIELKYIIQVFFFFYFFIFFLYDCFQSGLRAISMGF